MVESRTNEQRAEIDTRIPAASIIPAMVRIKKAGGVSLPDARDLFRARCRQLRAERVAEFSCGDEEYRSGYGECLFEAMAKGW